MADVFVSYSRKDIDFARRLVEKLKAAGRDTWIDWEGIPYSVDFWREICAGIDAADTFLFIISPDSLSSRVCNLEIDFARKNFKRIVPVLHRNPDEKVLAAEWFGQEWEDTARDNWKEIRKLNWLFFRAEDDFDKAFASLVDTAEQDPAHVHQHTRLLVRAKEWDANTRNPAYALRGDDLQAADVWLAASVGKTPQPTDLHRDYIAASRVAQAAEDKRRRNLNQARFGLVLAIALVAVLGLVFLNLQSTQQNSSAATLAVQATRVADQAGTAVAAQGTAQSSGATAVSERDRADQQAQLAQDNAATSNANAATAIAAVATSDRRSQELQSVAWGANAQQALSADDSDLALALALQANTIPNPDDSAQAALEAAAAQPGTRRLLRGHTGQVNALAFSPDGGVIVSAGNEGRLIGWNITTGGENFRLDIEIGDGSFLDSDLATQAANELGIDLSIVPIEGVAVSPHSQTALAVLLDASIRLFDLETGAQIRQFDGDGRYGIAISPDGAYAVTGSESPTFVLWDMRTGNKVLEFKGHRTSVRTVAFSPDGARVVSGSDDGEIIVWDVETGKERLSISGHTDIVNTVSFSPDNHYVLSGSQDGTLTIWDTESDNASAHSIVTASAVHAAAFTPDGRTVLAALADSTIGMWEVETQQLVRRYIGHGDIVASLAVSPDGLTFVSGARDGDIRWWYIGSPAEVRRLPGRGLVAVGADNQLLTATTDNQNMVLWDWETGEIIRQFDIGDTLVDVKISPDGRTALSTDCNNANLSDCDESYIRLWDLATGEELQQTEIRELVTSVAYSPDGQTAIFTEGLNGHFQIWDLNTWEQVGDFGEGLDIVLTTAYSPDGQYLLAGGAHFPNLSQVTTVGGLTLWDVATGEAVRTFEGHDEAVYEVVWSADGQYMVSAAADNTAILWDVQTEQPLNRFTGHTDIVLSVAISPDDRYIATGAADNRIILWDRATGTQIATYEGHQDRLNDLAFSPDGKFLLSVSRDQTLRVWRTPMPLDELIRWTYQNRYVPELTCEQRLTYRVEPYCNADGLYPTRTPYPGTE